MVMRYDGVEFDSVDDLVKYKSLTQMMQKTKVDVVSDKVQSLAESLEIPYDELVETRKNHQAKNAMQDRWLPEWDRELMQLERSRGSMKKNVAFTSLAKRIGKTLNACKCRVWTLTLRKGKNKNKTQRFTESDINAIKEYYASPKFGKHGRMDKLARKIGHSKGSIQQFAYKTGLAGNKKVETKQDTGPKTMIRKTPVIPQPEDKVRVDIAEGKPVVQSPVLEDTIKPVDAGQDRFPDIYPVPTSETYKVEQLVKHMIGNKGNLTRYDVQAVIHLGNDMAWDGNLWREFCFQFMFNSGAIARYFNVKPSNFKLDTTTGYHVIKCVGDSKV